ncbi:ATP-binding cassette domain-containing protein [Bacillus sp. 3A_MP1]
MNLKTYPKALMEISSLNFSINIEENEFVSIVGKSGSGKTTLLNIISLLDYPDEGKVVILGYENPEI